MVQLHSFKDLAQSSDVRSRAFVCLIEIALLPLQVAMETWNTMG